MSVSLEKLTELLTECDVSKSDQLKDALARVGQAHADLAAERVVAELTESGVITPLQSELLLAGRNLVLGHYILREKIGEGGMGTVYAARHRHMGRQVALKVIRPDRFKDPGFIERFRREIQLAARLRHTNIVVAYDAGEDHGALYLVMELVEGCDLARHVRRYGALDLPTALDAVRQAACGLAYLHSQKLVHRDIKPSNLLLDRQGVVKILDLGLSRLVEWSEAVQAGVYSTATIPGEPMGSVDFMSPEQFVNARLVDARADLYSLGCTLYGLLTGRPPFPGMSPGERIIAHREHPIPSLRNVVPDAPPGLERLFQRLLAKNPALRPSDANRVIAEIDALGILRSSSGVPAAAIAAEFAETEVFPRAPSATGRMTKSRLIASVCAIVGVALTALAISRYRTVGGDKTVSPAPATLVAAATGTTPDRQPVVRPSRSSPTAAPDNKDGKKKVKPAETPKPVVTLTPAITQPAAMPKPAATPPPTAQAAAALRPQDKDQLAALWALKLGGQVLVGSEIGFFAARSPGELPSVAFQVIRMNLAGLTLAATEPSPLAELRNLELIDLGNSDVDDRVLADLARLDALTNLSLMRTKIGDEGIKHLDGLVKLRHLDLRGNLVTDAGIAHLAARHSLHELRLGEGQNVTDEGAMSLTAMRSLKGLGLRGTAITDKAVLALAALEHLEWLDLGDCVQLTDESLTALGQYKSLKRVALEGVSVSPRRISELQISRHLKVDR